jgi:phosphinothricin acetyltransferase
LIIKLVIIRIAKFKDLKDITDIYNRAISETVSTFDTKPKKLKEQNEWFKKHCKKYPIIVAVKNDKIVGWAALSRYSSKQGYSHTSELSLYVKKKFQGLGIGKKLMEGIIKEGKKADLHVIISRITSGNKISIDLHEAYGFSHVGILKEVGYKFGNLLDVYLMQRIYK